MSNIDKINSLTYNQLVLMIEQQLTKRDILQSVGITTSDPRAIKALQQLLNTFNLNVPLKRRKLYTDADVIAAVKSSNCISDVLDKLGLTKHGSNFNTIRMIIRRLNIDDNHLSATVGRLVNTGHTNWNIDNIFVENSSYSRGGLRSKVISYNILPNYECSICGNNGSWYNKELKLVVDHINVINNDNRPLNLRWLCPNCHSQTPTFGTTKQP
jgi:hypothetical protein